MPTERIQGPNQDAVLRFMRKALAECESSATPPHPPRVSDLMNATLRHLKSAGLVMIPGLENIDWFGGISTNPVWISLTQAYQRLITFGYIVPAVSPQGVSFMLHAFNITDLGREWMSGADPMPEDITGYLDVLDALVPNVDPVIRQYVEEALHTYNDRRLFASAVMIGAASEKAVYLLMEALRQSVSDPTEKRGIDNDLSQRGLPAMFRRLYNHIERARRHCGMDSATHEMAHSHLVSLQDAIRVQRNDAVHPQTAQVEPASLRLSLAAFPYACKKVYDLVGWFKTHRDSDRGIASPELPVMNDAHP